MEKKKSNNLAVCIICSILTSFGLVANIVSWINGVNSFVMFLDMLDIAIVILIVYYAISGYRKPHGNLLKYIILIYTANYVGLILAQSGLPWCCVIHAIIIGILCYIAGRLHRVRQNVILMSIVTALNVIWLVPGFVKGVSTIGSVTPLIIWIDICVAYFLRYKEHKLAGLMDKAEN